MLVKFVVKFMFLFLRTRTSGFQNFPELVQENSRFWPNFGFRLNHVYLTSNFMEITNMWFHLSTAQWLRRCGYFRFTSGIFLNG
jgi:hypothetical protein